MKTKYSNVEYLCKKILLELHVLRVFKPAIPFINKSNENQEKNLEKVKDNFKKISVPLGGNNGDTMEWSMPIFEQGNAEDWVKWRIHFEELVKAYPLDTAPKKKAMYNALLCGIALDRFNTAYLCVEVKNKELDDNKQELRHTPDKLLKMAVDIKMEWIFNNKYTWCIPFNIDFIISFT